LLACVAAASLGSGVPEALPGAVPFPAALRSELARELAQRGPDYVPRSRHVRADGSPQYTNRLLLEASPYLQQHAHNPVSWHPWGDEAFETARRLGRPVFLSIGYSTCHWCHVMEEESFDDPEVARFLNEHFVAIKVDREVRPDVDAVYMSAVQALSGGGGWPLNVWTTPEGEPFYGGTYFPPRDRPGRPAFLSVLRSIAEQYETRREQLGERAERLSEAVRRSLARTPVGMMQEPSAAPLHEAFEVWSKRFDVRWGGLARRPKFPSSLPVRFLLRYHRRTKDPLALEMATVTLERMAAGGIHDQLGGGFHRYSVDERWLVPHFEKMLYDNALRTVEYLEAWQVTGRDDFERVVRSTLDYVAREMTAPEGGFYSATDADSRTPEGELEEGWFFTWTPAELDAALSEPEARLARALWGVTPEGNLDGRTVLHTWREPEAVARELGIDAATLATRIEQVRKKLLEVRSLRPPPLRDEKVLAAWNGLMISAFAQAGFALNEPRWVAAATRAADFALTRMRHEGRLLRVVQRGRGSGPAFLEDHAFLIAGLLDLYEADPKTRWLREALALQEELDRRYGDADGGGYYRTAAGAERLLVREKPARDGALPSGNSVAAANLLRLADLTLDPVYAERAALLFAAFDPDLEQSPTRLAELLVALDRRLDRSKEIVIVRPTDSAGGMAALEAPLRRAFVPNRFVARVVAGDDLAAHAALVPVVKAKRPRAGRATAYVCYGQVCQQPTADPEVFARQLEMVSPLPSGSRVPLEESPPSN
jgi:uncharacterized protein YyaL (SSP411 family)